MKKLLVAATALFLITGSLHAQTNSDTTKTKHHRSMHGRNGMANLNLTNEQKTQLKALNEGYRQQFAALKGNADNKDKIAALRKEQHEKMQAILTPEQKTQLASQRKNFGQKMKGGEAKHFDRMKTQLGLTDEQTKKLKDSQAGVHEKIKSIRQDQTLSESQKKEQVRAIMKDQREKMKSILTPEQLQKMKSGHKNKSTESAR